MYAILHWNYDRNIKCSQCSASDPCHARGYLVTITDAETRLQTKVFTETGEPHNHAPPKVSAESKRKFHKSLKNGAQKKVCYSHPKQLFRQIKKW